MSLNAIRNASTKILSMMTMGPMHGSILPDPNEVPFPTKRGSDFDTMFDVVNCYGVANIRVQIPMRRLQSVIPGFPFAFVNREDPADQVICRITEERYRVQDNYKIEFMPDADYRKENVFYGKEGFYLMDFDCLCKAQDQDQPLYRIFVITNDGFMEVHVCDDKGPL